MEDGKLLAQLKAAMEISELSMGYLTVMKNDPYRRDTEAGHRDGEWFGEQVDRILEESGRRSIHLRGVHYALVAAGDIKKPNGATYLNINDDWFWLQNKPASYGRWLEYVEFSSISDQRNTPPIINSEFTFYSVRNQKESKPESWVDNQYSTSRMTYREEPYELDIVPSPECEDFTAPQPYHLVVFGEKSSLKEIVGPIARQYNCDLYLPTGEISDTQLARMASDGHEDGRPMRVFTLTDSDPSGYQMSISIGRKLQAMKTLKFQELDFEVHPIALTVEQVKELGLPSTPLKETEKRKDKWMKAFGVEQTEIDALATLQPDVLIDIVEKAIKPFWDFDLNKQLRDAQAEWKVKAQKAIVDHIDQDALRGIAEEIKGLHKAKVDLNNKFTDLGEKLDELIEGIELPEIVEPKTKFDIKDKIGDPLITTKNHWIRQTILLGMYKEYWDNEEE